MSDKEFGGNEDLSLPKGSYHHHPIPLHPMVTTMYNRNPAGNRKTYLADHLAARTNTLPATVSKIVSEILSAPTNTENNTTPSMNFAKETRDLLIECCVEFITMISAEANEIAEKDAKKTIACEHITKALEDLGFGEYVGEVLRVADGFKSTQVHRERKQTKIEQSGMTNEELIRAQEELFRSAGEKYQGGAGGDGEGEGAA